MNVFSLLHSHTIDIYDLRNKQYEIKKVSARSLLNVKRFDLFAKLYYIRHLSKNQEKALTIYEEHIKAFNPDKKEPGQDDKTSLAKFVDTFNILIDTFQKKEFDENTSLIPVGSDNVILDGAHRIAALAYYNKDVTIVRFNGVKAIVFDYDYFKKRGLSWCICDAVAVEMARWLDNLKAVCIWPSVKNKVVAIDMLSSEYQIGYLKFIRTTFSALVEFVGNVYKHQSWASDASAVRDKASCCYGGSKEMCLILIDAPYTDELIEVKDKIRNIYGLGNHSLHITDNMEETAQIVDCGVSISSNMDVLSEYIYRFRYIHWLRFKVFVASLIRYNT